MRWMPMAAMLLSACGSRDAPETVRGARPGNVQETALAPAPPAYGPEREMQGIWTTSFEHSGFTRCSAQRLESCVGAPECWFEPSEAFWQRFERAMSPPYSGQEDARGDNFYIRFLGRQANNGGFGHLNGYLCQVEGIALISAERGLP